MFHIVLLTKVYNIDDFTAWLSYHSNIVDKIHILDNESEVSIQSISNQYNTTYTFIQGWPDQYNLYDHIFNDNIFNFNNNDYVICIDDDEYLWYDKSRYSSLTNSVNFYIKQSNSLLIPQILMSTKEFSNSRSIILPLFSTYRRNDYTSQGKAVIKYDKDSTYLFKHFIKQQGHVPLINCIRTSNVVSDVDRINIASTTYGITAYTAGLRLYHYHIKSKQDWNKKYSRGSAALQHQWYDKDITKNINFGQYTIKDTTLYDIFKKA